MNARARSAAAPPPLPGVDEAELVARARRGERAACEHLYRRHVHRVAGLIYRLMGSDRDLDDVVQDSLSPRFAVLVRSAPREDGALFWPCGPAAQ